MIADVYATKQDFQIYVEVQRLRVNMSTPEEILLFYTDAIGQLLGVIGDAVIRSRTGENDWQMLASYDLFISAKESFAAERSAGTITYGRGKMQLTPSKSLPNHLYMTSTILIDKAIITSP